MEAHKTEARQIGDRVYLCHFHRDSDGARRQALLPMAASGVTLPALLLDNRLHLVTLYTLI